MKKIISILSFIVIVLVAITATTIGAFAEESEAKLKVYAYLIDGTRVEVSSHTDMEEGWHAAMSLSLNDREKEKNGYIFLSVDILSDWKAENGKFSDKSEYEGVSFSNGAIYIPKRVCVEINLNGHTIDRGLSKYKYNGEVICIDQNADVAINGGKDMIDTDMGKITGGFSCNGAGGIHMHDKSSLHLNYVSVSGNCTEDDDGAGIALYNGATLSVYGGEISNNVTYCSLGASWAQALLGIRYRTYGAGVYVKDASASFQNVNFTNNKGGRNDADEGIDGDVIAALNSTVTMTNCNVFENSIRNADNEKFSNVFYIVDSTFTVDDCEIYNNGSKRCYLFLVEDSTINIYSSNIYNNGTEYVVKLEESTVNMNKNNIHDNDGGVISVYDTKCSGEIYTSTFNNNSKRLTSRDTFNFIKKPSSFYFCECDFGNSTFNNKNYAQYQAPHVGTMSAEGTGAIFTSLASLAVSFTALVIVVVNNKKKKAPVGVKEDTLAETVEKEVEKD